MKRLLLLMLVLVCCGITQANLVLNGDFEDPDVTGTNVLSPLTSWKTLRGDDQANLDDKGSAAQIPGLADNQVVRLKQGTQTGTLRQFLIYNWASGDVYTLQFNASETWWQAGEDKQNAIDVLLKDKDNGWDVLWTTTVDLDGTHDGLDAGDWKAAQTFSFTIDASTFTTGAEGGQLILEFVGAENVNYLDNVSFIPEPASLILLGIGSFVALRKKR